MKWEFNRKNHIYFSPICFHLKSGKLTKGHHQVKTSRGTYLQRPIAINFVKKTGILSCYPVPLIYKDKDNLSRTPLRPSLLVNIGRLR